MNRYEIALDLDKAATRRRFTPVILRQNDLHGCEIAATIYDHGTPLERPELSAYVVIGLPSGSYYRDVCEWDGTVAVVTIDESIAASELGKARPAYFELRDGEDVIATTQDFPVTSIPSATGGDVPEPYDSLIEQALAEVAEAASHAESAAQSVSDTVSDAVDAAMVGVRADVDEAIADAEAATARADAA